MAFKGAASPDNAAIEQAIRAFAADDFFSPEERVLISCPEPTDIDRIQLSWRFECLKVICCELGFIEWLYRPERLYDVAALETLSTSLGRSDFSSKARLPPQSELLDATDLPYRYHCAVREEPSNGREPLAGLDDGVVIQRHHALNWLISYMDKKRDEVTTDT